MAATGSLGIGAVACVLSGGIRIYGLNGASFWWDESFTWWATQFPELVTSAVAGDVHPPAYFWLVALWRTISGTSEFAFRMPSVLFSTLTLVILVLHMQAAANSNKVEPVLILIAIYIFLPYDIHLSRFARGYTMLIFLCSAFSLCYFRLIESDKTRYFILAACLGLLAIHTHYLAIIYVFASMVAGLSIRPSARSFLRSAFLGLLLVLGFLPWLDTLIHQLDIKAFHTHYYSIAQVKLPWFQGLINPAPVGLLFSRLNPGSMRSFFGVLTASSGFLCILITIRELLANRWTRALLIQSCVIVLAMSFSPTPLFNDKNVCILLPSVVLLLAYGLAHLFPGARLRPGALWAGVFVALSLSAFPHQNDFPDWRSALEYAGKGNTSLGETRMVTCPPWDTTTIPYYYSRGVMDRSLLKRTPISCSDKKTCSVMEKCLKRDGLISQVVVICAGESSPGRTCKTKGTSFRIVDNKRFRRITFYRVLRRNR
jgi:4-amino-4-deoxy-L-arabinose transferase-like glycosyltransferase